MCNIDSGRIHSTSQGERKLKLSLEMNYTKFDEYNKLGH